MKEKQSVVPITVKTVWPHQLAWLRRPELENGDSGQVWERPDGSLFHYHAKFPLKLAIFPKREPIPVVQIKKIEGTE